MATIQTGKLAMQYGQRFTHANTVASSPAVTTIDPTEGADHGNQSSHYYPQSNQTSVQKEPIILNHALINNVVAPNVVSSVLSGVNSPHMQHPNTVQQQMAPQMQPPTNKLYILVEWESINGEPNSFSVIDTSELILHSTGGSAREILHTGKTIFVRKYKKVQKATIVMISDDKQFIDTELRQLRKMAADNLFQNTVAAQELHTVATNQEQQAKRRRVETIVTPSEEQEPASPEYEPMPTQSQIATANWVNNCKNERIVSPSPSVMSVQVGRPATFSKPPPMTFDQQTQTDTRFFPQENNRSNEPELAKILSLLETILTEQKSIRMETEYNRKLTLRNWIHDLLVPS